MRNRGQTTFYGIAFSLFNGYNPHVFEETSGIVCGNRSEGLGKRFVKCIDRARS
jgi:hypothetical protein